MIEFRYRGYLMKSFATDLLFMNFTPAGNKASPRYDQLLQILGMWDIYSRTLFG
jgi:hypothetical protein